MRVATQLLCLFLMLMYISTSCSTISDWHKESKKKNSKYKDVPLNHQPLAKQRLIPRPNYKGLTNKVCLEFDHNDKCVRFSVREYLLTDPEVRRKLREFKIACRVGGKRYRICGDRDGFCRSEKHCTKWGKTIIKRRKVCRKHKITKKFLPVSDYSFLLDGGMVCKAGY